ncbi:MULTISPECIES: hypothetical protein [spotted fever group]|uniref:Uncharacterized protein n=1 Tax=Rickettsia tamurae subsp. buchneri TaxID=1462938 RepID=A0A8E0WKA0_9RICK|nr:MULTISPECIES: hypothetical protein [spotted fever group]EER20767.1 hypothetical protein REIS_2277 [Rickettsia endosymbiont of Ixodes scapularis]KDO02128.1 hypothetical protein REISMN_08725 [Rickettsia tamurae subsp. buchneri]
MRVKTISVLMLLCLALQILTNAAFAQYLDEQLETNINKVDPLFERSVPNLEEFKAKVEQDKKAISEQIGQNKMPPIADSGKIVNERAKLESLDVLELDSIARREMAKDLFHNEMFVDLSKAGMQAHLEDAKKIANGSSKMIGGIIANLKDIGVDCKTVKGNIERDPEYFMEIERTQERSDTIYDQVLCEELRNKYNCREDLTLKCSEKAIRYTAWQQRKVEVTEEELDQKWGKNWVAGRYFEDCWEQQKNHRRFADYVVEDVTHMTAGSKGSWSYYTKIREYDPNVQIALKIFISNKLGVSQDNIGHITTGYTRNNNHRSIIAFLSYQYRDSYEICSQWYEDWSEVCIVN